MAHGWHTQQRREKGLCLKKYLENLSQKTSGTWLAHRILRKPKIWKLCATLTHKNYAIKRAIHLFGTWLAHKTAFYITRKWHTTIFPIKPEIQGNAPRVRLV